MLAAGTSLSPPLGTAVLSRVCITLVGVSFPPVAILATARFTMSQMIVSCGCFIGCGLSPSSLKTPAGRDLWAGTCGQGFSSLQQTPSNQGLLSALAEH